MLLQLTINPKQAELLKRLEGEATAARQRFADAFTVAVAGAGFGEGTVYKGLSGELLIIDDPSYQADENGVKASPEPDVQA